MQNPKILRLIDLINDIKKVDALIQLHLNLKDSEIITLQYVAKKNKLISYFIDELITPQTHSANSFHTIKLIIEKFYSTMEDDNYQEHLQKVTYWN